MQSVIRVADVGAARLWKTVRAYSFIPFHPMETRA